MRITTTVDLDAGSVTIRLEGRVELLATLHVELPGVVADAVAYALVTRDDRVAWPGESRWRATRLLGQGMTERQVAQALGVDADQVRRWDDDAAIDGVRDVLVDRL